MPARDRRFTLTRSALLAIALLAPAHLPLAGCGADGATSGPGPSTGDTPSGGATSPAPTTSKPAPDDGDEDDDDAPPTGGTQPGGTQPGGTQPGGTQPGGTQPGGTQAGGTQPGGTQAGGTQPGGTQPGGTQPGGMQAVAGLYGVWYYTTSFYPKPSGEQGTASIGGELTLRSDGTWEHFRRIGNVVANGRGKFAVQGNVITLKHADGASQDLVYKFLLGTHTDEKGQPFRALTLDFGQGYSYLLVAENK